MDNLGESRLIKKLIITMIAIAALTGVAIAADPQAPTMPFYWVTGKVLNPGQLNGRPVILYAKDYSDTKVISVIPDGSGNFTINTYELYFYHKNDNWVEIGGKPAFIVGVKRQNPDDYGTAEAATAIWDNGYLTIDLNLVVGGGPLEGASQIAGVVTAEANGDPIAGALLSEDSNGKSTVSGADGAYLFPGDFAAGSTVGVACSAVSYDSANKNTSPLVANQVTWVNFALAGGGIVDTGLIQGTDIIRVTDDKDSNIKITWGYKSGSGIVAADIWWLQGTYKEMSSNTNDWQPAPSGQNLSDGVTGWQAGNAVKVMDGNNAYYRIVPAG
ncbi:MAG: carboxypeptidase-like regulatory domain-containing protein, partial [Candidatus Margulisbacteria bacterium]|nr:carboxypeptidase-like regulatory domain-containing protein [Candidatus Margulisiibacteriota bacterium]